MLKLKKIVKHYKVADTVVEALKGVKASILNNNSLYDYFRDNILLMIKGEQHEENIINCRKYKNH